MTINILAIVSSLAQSTPGPPPVTPPPQPTIEQGVDDADLGVSTMIDVEGGAGYSSRPALDNDSSGQAFGRLAINASHVRRGERSTTVLSLYGENTTYSGRSDSQQLLRAMARHQVEATEKLQVFGDVSASLDRGGQLGTRLTGIPIGPAPIDPDVIPPLPSSSTDLSLIGERTYRVSGQAGARITLSRRDSMTMRSGAERVIFRGGGSNNDFTSLFASASYDRQFNERASGGIYVNVRRSDYEEGRTARSITPQLTGRLLLSERVELQGAAGVSIAENDDGDGTERSVGLTFNGAICRRSELQTFCARVARDQQADGFAGASKILTFDVNYSRQIDQKQSIQLVLGASRQSGGFDSTIDDSGFGRTTYLRAAGSYTRNVGPRLLTGVNVAARSLRREGPNPNPDLSASVFVRWRLGDLR